MLKEGMGQVSGGKQSQESFHVVNMPRNQKLSPVYKSLHSSYGKKTIDLDDSCLVLQQPDTKPQIARKQTISPN